MRHTIDGLITELGHHEKHGGELALRMQQSAEAWHAEDRVGHQAVLDLPRVPGAPYPPIAAWDSAVAAGMVSKLEPTLALELGWYYSEISGIHSNNVRQVPFQEHEVMPRVLQGAAAFYGPDGKLKPEFQVHLKLYEEFVADLKRLSAQAGELHRKLQSLRAKM